MKVFTGITLLLLAGTMYGAVTLRATAGNVNTLNSGATESQATSRVLNSIALKTDLSRTDTSLALVVVSFDDPVFEECVRTKLNKPTQAITSFEISGISSMKCSGNMKLSSMFKHLSHKAKVIVEIDNTASFEYELIRIDGKSDYVNITEKEGGRIIGSGKVGMSLLHHGNTGQYADPQVTWDNTDDSTNSTEDPYDNDSQTCNDTGSADDDTDDDDDTGSTDDPSDEAENGVFGDDYDSGYGAGAPGATSDEFNGSGEGIGRVVNTGDDYDPSIGSSGESDQGAITTGGVGAVINKVGADELVKNSGTSATLTAVIDSIIGRVER